MSAQVNLSERKVYIGDAVVFNSRRIEKLEEFSTLTQEKLKFLRTDNLSVEKTVELQVQLKSLQDKYNQLLQLVTKLEASVEEGQHVSLNITENDSDE